MIPALAMMGAITLTDGQSLRITGTIIDSAASTGIADADIRLAGSNPLSAKSGIDGAFILSGTVTAAISDRLPKTRGKPSLHGNKLTLTEAPVNGKIHVEVFNGIGSRIYGNAATNGGSGNLTFSNLWEAPGFYYVKVSQGHTDERLFPLAKANASYALTVSKPGYDTKWITAPAETANLGTIRLSATRMTAPVLYTPDRVLSPMDATIVQRMKNIAANGSGLRKPVFMKVGDSNSLLSYQGFVNCFNGLIDSLGTRSGFLWPIDLDGRDSLASTILYFRSARIGPDSPYGRNSTSVIVGSKAGDHLSGPSPTLLRELDTTKAQFAIVMFGSNDIQGALPSNIEPYEAGMRAIADTLIAHGVIPIYTTMPHASAYPNTVPSFAAVARAIAQGRQFPLIDLNMATRSLGNQGLADPVHLSTKGSFEACQFSEAKGDLQFGMNTRNLITMQMLHRIKKSFIDGGQAPDANVARLQGDGSPGNPFLIDTLPYVDMRDVRKSARDAVGRYACTGSQPAPGKEYLYRLILKQRTAIRVLVLDAQANAVNVNLLSTPNPNACLKSASRMIETTIDAGTYHIAVDGNSAGAGAEYTLAVTACVAGDGACSQ